MGGGCCNKVGGYENPAVAAWAIAVSLQAVVSLTLLLLSDTPGLEGSLSDALEPSQYGMVMFVTRGSFIGLGALHAALFLITMVVTMLGYFFCSPFLCLMCPMVLINKLACLITCGFGGYMLSWVYDFRTAALDYVRANDALATRPVSDFSIDFVHANASLILLATAACLCCLVPLSRAWTIDEKGSMVDVMLHLPIVMGAMALAGLLLFLSRLEIYMIMGSVWLVAALGAAAFMALQKCGGLTTKIATLVLTAYFALVLAICLGCCCVFGVFYLEGRTQAIRVLRTPPLMVPALLKGMTDNEYWMYKNYVVQNDGGSNMAVVVISAFLVVYCFVGAAFSLRSLIGSNDSVNRRDSAGGRSDS